MFYFFVSFPIIAVQPAIYNSYFRKICHGLRSFPTIECTLCEHSIVMKKRMCLGTFSRRGAVALATIYPCAECASSRSIFIVWKRSFLYDKKECVEVPVPAAASRVSDIFHSAAVRSAQKRLSGVSREPFFEFCILIAGRRSSFRLWA